MDNEVRSIIKLRGVSKKFGPQVVLEDVNIDIIEGSITAIVGESGSGKTTLLNIIGLLENPDKGDLYISDDLIKFNNERQRTKLLRTKINYLFQNFALVDNETVDYNLDIGLKFVNKSREKKISLKRKVLENVGLDSFGDKRIFQLSGGEQQRVSIARSLLKPCELILADEPTGSLDEKNGKIVMSYLHDLNRSGKTILIVTHNLDVANQCDNIIRIGKNEE